MVRTAIGLIVWIFLTTAAQAEKRIALLIGNQGYGGEIGRLANPHNDIALVEKSLSGLGFEVAIERDASLGTLTRAVNAYARRLRAAGPNAIGFFYYSGHGAADGATNYLIPVDVKTTETGELWDQSLRLTEITRKLKAEAGNATHFVVFDACRNTLRLTKTGSRALVQAKGFVPVAQESGMLIAYATAEGELASDAGTDAGPYAKVLADEIVKPGVEAVAMFRVVQRRVRQAINQEPYLGFNAMGDVYLGGAQAQPGKAAPAEPAALPWRLSEAAEAWAATKDTTNSAVLEAFIDRYKNTYYAVLARERIEELKKPQPESVASTAVPRADGSPKDIGSSDKPAPGTSKDTAGQAAADPPRGWLGVKIQNIDEDTAASLGLSEPKGALVTEVTTPGPAAEAGLKNGDAILSVNGSAVADSRDLARQIAGFSPNSKVDMRILRGQTEQTVAVKLGKRVESGEPGPHQPHGTEMDQLGLRVAPGTGANMDRVVVTEIDNNSNAAQKGIKTGDVILEVGGLTLKNPEDLANGIKEATKLGRKAVLVRVKSGDQTRFVAVPLNTTANKTSPQDLQPELPADHSPRQSSKNPPKEARNIRVPELRFTVVAGSEDNPSIAVTDVDKDSDAAQKGVKSGDSIKEIGGLNVKNPQDVARGVSEAMKLGRKAVLLRIQSDKGVRFVAIRMTPNETEPNESSSTKPKPTPKKR